jgi:hypothetical protein
MDTTKVFINEQIGQCDTHTHTHTHTYTHTHTHTHTHTYEGMEDIILSEICQNQKEK